MKRSVDVAIVAALPVERDALLRRVSAYEVWPDPESVLEYYLCTWRSDKQETHKLLIASLQRPGNVYAATIVKALLASWAPAIVVSFGIAGGVRSRNRKKLDRLEYGDIIVGETVFYYEHATEGAAPDVKLWPSTLHCDSWLTSFARTNYESPTDGRARPWQSAITIPVPKPLPQGHPCVRVGAIASGEKVIRSIDAVSRKRAEQHYSKVLAFEMEAFGVAAASTAFLWDKYKFVAVKGIADYAGEDKGDLWHAYASESAAAFLFDYLAELNHHRPFSALKPRQMANSPQEISDRVKALVSEIPNHFIYKYNTLDLRRCLAGPTVDVFYHWRVLHQHMHWVDFCFLLVLNKLRRLGYRINLVATDRLHPKPLADVRTPADLEKAKEEVIQVVKRVLGDQARLWWYGEIEARRSEFDEYAREEGLAYVAEETIDNIRHLFGKTEGNEVVKTWLKFIAWFVRGEQRCIILEWKMHAEMWRQILNYIHLSPAIIETADLKIGNNLGKLEPPGVHLVVNPPTYPQIMEWVLAERSPVRLRNFWWYLSLQEGEIYSYVKRQRETRTLTQERLLQLAGGEQLVVKLGKGRRLSELDAYRLGIAACLIEWTAAYFWDWPSDNA